ncbi:unnamed protein product [Strongylus vulgaris]|uniref:Uncharacterized protein n=1 Tax=Strongylus vulgaris TaxID=40348 RepID=A0A3P7J0J5_STRVU|nr:unnamed protein product [Strongylus vulgaris]
MDRHWNKKHFIKSQCAECGWLAAAPLRLVEHAYIEHSKKICGYCGAQDPPIDHVADAHWRRLNKSVALKKKDRKKTEQKPNSEKVEQDVGLSCEEEKEVSSDDESVSDGSLKLRCE